MKKIIFNGKARSRGTVSMPTPDQGVADTPDAEEMEQPEDVAEEGKPEKKGRTSPL